MRSTRRSRAALVALATIVDRAGVDVPGHVLVHVEGPVHAQAHLAVLPLHLDAHPFEVLGGFTAPASWTAVGIRARGRAHHLDRREAEAQEVAATFLVDRTGAEASVLRLGDVVSRPSGPATGTIPDVARRVLGLPTDAPPTSTAPLWTSMWLDRVLERWAQPLRRRDLTSSWGQIAVLHPAVHAPSPADVVAFADPATLVSAARSHERSSSWGDLRRSPLPLTLPDGALPHAVARWMDDGFFARWAIGAFPPIATTALDLGRLLGAPLGPRLLATTLALLQPTEAGPPGAAQPSAPAARSAAIRSAS